VLSQEFCPRKSKEIKKVNNINSFCLNAVVRQITANVLQAKVGGLSKHQLTLPTKGYLKILTLLVSRKQIVCRFNARER
jgi:hypothetical protein